jgi:hypothetical protein
MAPKSKKSVAAFDSGFLNSGLVLYHRREVNRHLQVQISEDKQIEKPTEIIEHDTKSTQIPCEIIGLDCKKAKKPIKVRFHPDVLKQAKRNESVAKSVYKTVYKVGTFFNL